MLCLKHNLLLEFAVIAIFICVGTTGVLAGLANSAASTHIYMALTFCSAVVLLYIDQGAGAAPAFLAHTEEAATNRRILAVRRAPSAFVTNVAYLVMIFFAFAGGYLTACVGFGADICLYSFGHLLWNQILPHRKLSDEALSASSVVAMGALSFIATLVRAVTGGISQTSLHCWGTTACIVCIGGCWTGWPMMGWPCIGCMLRSHDQLGVR